MPSCSPHLKCGLSGPAGMGPGDKEFVTCAFPGLSRVFLPSSRTQRRRGAVHPPPRAEPPAGERLCYPFTGPAARTSTISGGSVTLGE
ncbi:hypothetical protein ACFFX0_23995 [Citricoccus parietis]|uniref:Uncharacterized protein n=1 Tax=Citricoccus parietis TaxID=592307 RepID=A0ABV5G562_9MICC